jgi:cytochrome c peroxidase
VTRPVLLLAFLAACPKGDKKPEPNPNPGPDDASRLLPPDDATLTLGPPPPLPTVPAGLPPPPDLPKVTPAAVALGELLFYDPRLSSTGKLSCASCHDPAHGYAGGALQTTAQGKENLRRAPALVNLAWQRELGWDGRYPSLEEQLPPHIRGQMGDELGASILRVADLPLYRAHLARNAGIPGEAALDALAAFVLTRYTAEAPWDRMERTPQTTPPDVKAGYQLFTAKAQCAVCHTPPLYTDLRYHRVGLIASKDEGRGRVERGLAGAFKTPTLRGAANQPGFFHDASATTLDAAIDWHLAGGVGQGADPSIVDPALKKVTLTPAERAQLGAFVRALTGNTPAPSKPALP